MERDGSSACASAAGVAGTVGNAARSTAGSRKTRHPTPPIASPAVMAASASLVKAIIRLVAVKPLTTSHPDQRIQERKRAIWLGASAGLPMTALTREKRALQCRARAKALNRNM